MNYFTSDLHLGSNEKLKRENRPFKNDKDYYKKQIKAINKKVHLWDKLYVIGDLCNYNRINHNWKVGLKAVKDIHCDVILIIGNNEQRVIDDKFRGSFKLFRNYCIKLGFKDVKEDAYAKVNGTRVYLNHFPSKHKNGIITLFGHTHKATGLYKPYGLNVGVDLNNFEPYSEADIEELLERKKKWWDNDVDINCNK